MKLGNLSTTLQKAIFFIKIFSINFLEIGLFIMLKKISFLLSLTATIVMASPSISFSQLSQQAKSAQDEEPVIDFGTTKPLNTKPQERVYIAELTLSPQAKERHEKILELIKKGEILKAKTMAKAFFDEVNEIKKENSFLNTRSTTIEIEYLTALLDCAKIDMIMGESKAAALKTQEAFSLIAVFRNTHPIDFFLLAPTILDSMWEQNFTELADKYVSVVYPLCKTFFGGQVACAKLKINEGLAQIIYWKKKNEGLVEIQDARDQYAKQLGLASIEYIEAIYANALAYTYLNDYKSVEQILDFAMKEANVSVIHKYPLNPVFGKIYMLFGETKMLNFENKAAIDYYTKAVDFYLKTTGEKSVALAKAYKQLAIAQKYNKDFGDSAKSAVRAIDTISNIYGNDSVELVEYYLTLGGIYADWEKPKEGIEVFNLAKEINQKHRGSFNDLNKLIDSNIKYLENVSSYRWKK